MGILSKTINRTYDAALLQLSPRRYAIRQHFQRMENDGDYRDAVLLAMRVRGYRAAHESGSKTPFSNSSGSADREILFDLPWLRSRSRELNRDDALGSGITKTFVSNWVGAGMMAQAQTGDLDKNRRLESVWNSRKDALSQADDLTHGETQRLIARKILEDGDVVRKAVFSASEPVWFETVEGERLATPPGKTQDPKIRNGVERDDAGRPIAHWIRKTHPGDNLASVAGGNAEFERIPVAYSRLLKVTERPGQTRGVPLFHSVLQDLRDLDLLLLAALKRTQIAACLSVFIRSAAESPDMIPLTADKYGYKLEQALEPGMIFKLFPNEQIETLVPNFPTPELEQFVIMLCRRIGAALGICWSMVLKDFSKSNYSSARTDLLESRQTFTILQSFLIERYLNWEWETVMFDAWLRGDPRLDGITREELALVRWIPPGWRWVDPVKEATQAQIELEIGTTTLRDICASKGTDWEETMRQRLVEEKREREIRAELDLPEKQAKPAAPASGAQTAANDEEDDNAQIA